MTIRVVCKECGAKLDIREELAGSTRKCPKCKTEFQVPSTEAAAAEEASAADTDQDAKTAETELDAPAAAAAPEAVADPEALAPSSPSDDDEDEDVVPSFVTQPSSGGKSSAKRPSEEDEDDGPVLSIPKTPSAPRPKSTSFDPDEFLSEEPAGKGSRGKGRGKRNPFEEDYEAEFASRTRTSRAAVKDLNLPSPDETGLSDPGAPTFGGTRDRAQAARELRQALKESALKGPMEEEKPRGIGYDLSVLFSEIGIKGLAIFVGVLVLSVGLYFVSYRVLVGKMRLPELGYVTGTVTLDGSPAAGATVYFAPLESNVTVEGRKITPRTSIGMVDEKGRFKMMYLEGVPGVTVGKCHVWVTLPPPQAAQEYTQASMVTKEVTAGHQTVDIALTSLRRK